MLVIQNREIERVISNSRNRTLGYHMFQKSEVVEVYIVYNEAYKTFVVRAKVGNDALHLCYVEINLQGKVVNFECNCYFCDSYSGCSHIAAVLFKIQSLSPMDFPFHYKMNDTFREYAHNVIKRERDLSLREKENKVLTLKQEDANNFINQFVHQVDAKLMPGKGYDIEPVFSYDGDVLSVRYRVGDKQKYVIKDLKVFLNAIDHHLEIDYGKNLCFVHHEDAFSDDAKTHINFIKEINSLPSKDHKEDNLVKCLYLTYATIDSFYDTYCMDYTLSNLEFDEVIRKPEIKFEDRGEYYLVDYTFVNEFVHVIHGLKHFYSFESDKLTRIVFDDEGKCMRLIEKLIESPMYVNKNDIFKFYRFILKDIDQYITISGLKGIVNDKVELKRNLYGEIDEDGDLSFYVTCEYDNHLVIPANEIPLEKQSPTLERLLFLLEQYANVKKDYKYCILQNDGRMNEFLYNTLPILSKHCNLFISEELKFTTQAPSLSMNVGITIKQDLLHINLSSVDIPTEEIMAVLQSYRRKRKFHKMTNGDLVNIQSKELKDLDELMKRYGIEDENIENGVATLPMYRAFSIEQDSKSNSQLIFERSEYFKSVINELDVDNNKQIVLKEPFDLILRDYQKVGVSWLNTMKNYHFGGILADDMGLGKTLQIIALLETVGTGTSVIVAPASLILNWQDEMEKFSNNLKCLVIHGSAAMRRHLLKDLADYDVIVTSYDYLKRDIDLYQSFEFEYIILDEAQYIKNPKTLSAQVVKKLKGMYRFALTGTPIENSLAELWSIFDFLMRDYLYSYRYFQKHFEIPIVRDKDKDKQAELKKLIKPFILRRTKKDVLTELPDKIEKTIHVEFSENENKLYLGNLAQVNQELQSQLKLDKINKIEMLAMLTRLRQICCEPRIVYENITETSSKLNAAMELIEVIKQNKKKVLLFSSFTSTLDLIKEELEKRDISSYTLTGDVSKVKRRELVSNFQEDDTTVFLISLKAGGTGLNLTAAEAVIHFDPWWNISAQNQATDRAHRMGQNNTVEVYKLIMKNSIEEKIALLQEQKKDLADMFIDENEDSISTMSSADIMDLFKM